MSGCYVVFHKQLGDLLLLEPTLAKLHAHYGAPVAVITRSGHAPLLRLMLSAVFQPGFPLGWRESLYCFDPKSKSAWRSLITPARRKFAILPARSEVRWYHGPLFKSLIVPELGSQYIAEYFWENTPVPVEEPFRLPRLARPPDDWRVEEVQNTPYILINPTSGWRQKMWRADRWVQVLRSVYERLGVRFLMTSTSIDWQVAHCREIAESAGPIVQSLSSGTSLPQFLWLCSRASAILTVDGAASHLAQAFGVPSLTLFGPTSVENWHRDTDQNIAVQALPKDGKRSMKYLSTEPVNEAVGRLMENLPAQG